MAGLSPKSEKKFYALPDQLFTANGTTTGLITVTSTLSYKVGMVIACHSNTQSSRRLKIKRIISETQFYVGEENTNISTYTDMSTFLLADAAIVQFGEDKRPVIDILEIQRQVYEEEPTIALRTHAVDKLGRSFDVSNPLRVMNGEGILAGITYDDIQATYPDLVTENYTYYLATALVATIQITYTDATKSTLTRARRI